MNQQVGVAKFGGVLITIALILTMGEMIISHRCHCARLR